MKKLVYIVHGINEDGPFVDSVWTDERKANKRNNRLESLYGGDYFTVDVSHSWISSKYDENAE